MPRIEIRRLRYFIALAEELHFGRAAQRLNISQPPLSEQIRKLEEELGVRLFERTSRNVLLTEAGRIFLAGTYRALEEVERAATAASQAQRGMAGHLKAGYLASAGVTFLPSLLRHLRTVIPGLQFEFRQFSSSAALEALARRSLDVALVRTAFGNEAFASRVIHEDRLILALPYDHPLAREPELRLAQLHDEMFVLYPPNEGRVAYDVVQRACIQAGFVPRAVEFVEDVYGMLGLVAAGLGLAVVPGSIGGLRVAGVVFRELPDTSEKFALSLVWRKADETPLIERVVREICTGWAPGYYLEHAPGSP